MAALSQVTHGYLSDGGSSGATVLSVSGSVCLVTVTFSSTCTITLAGSDPANWGISGAGAAVEVTGVSFSAPDQVILTTTQQRTGVTYTVIVPAGAVVVGADPNPADSVHTFVGIGQTPTVISGIPKTLTSVVVKYSQPMDPSSASVPTNYVLAPALLVTEVIPQSSTDFLLITALQSPDTLYTGTITGVTDQVGNPI
jgi:hypothetical protein